MKIPIKKLFEEVGKIKSYYSPVEVIRFDNKIVRVAKFKDEYEWHEHDYDELFHVIKGTIIIQLKGEPNVLVNQGEYCVIPKGISHCPKSFEESLVLIIDELK